MQRLIRASNTGVNRQRPASEMELHGFAPRENNENAKSQFS